MRERVVVVGAGVGGLACAIRLAVAGHEVRVLERNDRVGGKLARRDRCGFRFDVGPTLLTLPAAFGALFATSGTTLGDELDLVRLDPQFHYRWPDGATLVVRDRAEDTAEAFEQFGAGRAWRRFDERGRRIWAVSERTFLAGPMGSPWELLRRMRSPRDLLLVDPLRTLHAVAADYFDDPRLVQWAGRYATYSGSSPFRAPATLTCVAHLESRYGCWFPRGGLDAVRVALERVARAVGVELQLGAEVVGIRADATSVRAVELLDGSVVTTSVVVANCDADHLYADLLPDPATLRRVRRAERSTSALVVAAAVRGRTTGIGHHNVWFSTDHRAEFAALDAGRLADEPTIYACVSSVTDATQAPDGCENWLLLAVAPAGIELDGADQSRLLLERLAARGVDLRGRVEWHEVTTPGDLAARYRAPGGAIYGTSSNGRKAAFLRPGNRGARRGLYLVGGSAHPGGGLPLVLSSARIVADLVHAELSEAGS